ncbi:DUF1329 domain-containing protein [Piscinibacter gummiphilus]|uniref:Uncharacterized protein n=1 Tax=Piscinibacter gummiphilus TaxID=946333 RepID=A0A1W6L6D7_9BURK|nr:DUF1329 domain-containing protein [Piscinibacter gummiphilus]ARN19698.1 hypothetical protein A4W93_07105 [Piscinibacter gummiphilus]ATU64367.1 DUF1329 domain-containing protein [Piscinibacter gummiphilus]GLS95239.1 hypothetical protein GCM10007918_25310 [Piscinibacter gummiphilus]
MNPIRHRAGALGLLALFVFAVQAKAPADQIDKLGKELTPVGAERAGNKDGTIPPWEGGVTKAPAGFDANKGWADPFPGDKPLYTITAANAEQYKDKLAPGQLALLKRYPSYKMPVYPTRRSAAFPESIYAAIKKEAGTIDTANEGNSVLDAVGSTVPFPIPNNGVEAIWNHAFRYRGATLVRHQTEFPVQGNGAFTPVKRHEETIFGIGLKETPNVLFYFRTNYKAPAAIAGEALLAHDFIDQVKQPRAAWVYNPGTRRVLRAPEVSYDTPRNGCDGLSTVDDYDGFNGSPDRFEWKLVGKREMIVSYNNNKLTDKGLKYTDIVKPGTINQDLVRYELHRVWVVEANLRQGKSHVYRKRVYYLDEDSWQIAHADLYDGRGELWRVLEIFGVQFYNAPAFFIGGSAQYDLQARRYVVSGLTNEEKPIEFNTPLKASDFTTAALRRTGN